jgi:antirestriction protein ArdC
MSFPRPRRGKPGAFDRVRRFTVFNADQCEDLPAAIAPPPEPLAENLILQQAEALIRATGAEIRIGGTRSFRLVQRSGRCVVRELHDGGGNPSR